MPTLIDEYFAVLKENGVEFDNPRLEAIRSRLSDEELQALIDRLVDARDDASGARGSFAHEIDELATLVEARDRLAQAKNGANDNPPGEIDDRARRTE